MVGKRSEWLTSAAEDEAPGRLGTLSQKSLPDQIAEAVLQAAARGKFRLGERLQEPELAKELGVSRVPVREALRILVARGIAVSTPQKGVRLMTADQQDLQNILVVRKALEQLALQERVQRKHPWSQGIQDALTKMEAAARDNDSEKLATADIEFHRAICESSGNNVLVTQWNTLADQMRIIMGIATGDKNFAQYYMNHVNLTANLKTGRLAAALKAIESHIMEASQWDPLRSLRSETDIADGQSHR